MTAMPIDKRFFAFGCSFTKYAWPTWADLVSELYSTYYNYGRPGGGNMFIFNSVMEADQRHKLTKDDLVIVQWSGPCREDRYLKDKWVTPGNIVNYYSNDYVYKYFDFRGFLLRDLAAIKATKALLDHIGCEYRFISMVPLITSNEYEQKAPDVKIDDVCQLYSNVLESIKPSYIDILGSYGVIRPKNLYGIKLIDNHPVPSEHFQYIKTVLPEFKLDEQLAISYDCILAEIHNTHNQGWNYDWPMVRKPENLIRL